MQRLGLILEGKQGVVTGTPSPPLCIDFPLDVHAELGVWGGETGVVTDTPPPPRCMDYLLRIVCKRRPYNTRTKYYIAMWWPHFM